METDYDKLKRLEDINECLINDNRKLFLRNQRLGAFIAGILFIVGILVGIVVIQATDIKAYQTEVIDVDGATPDFDLEPEAYK